MTPTLTLSALLRHAFMSGAGIGEQDKIPPELQARWTEYVPPDTKTVRDFMARINAKPAPERKETPSTLRLHRVEYAVASETIANVIRRSFHEHTNADELAAAILHDLQYSTAVPFVAPSPDQKNQEDAELIRLAIEETIRTLGGDPSAFVTDFGTTVFDLTATAVAARLKGGATG